MTPPTVTLYHGSFCAVEKPDLNRCSPYKDFGRGFYLTTNERQAKDFSRISLRKAIANGKVKSDSARPTVSLFYVDAMLWSSLNIRSFHTTDTDWLHCVVAHRRPSAMPHIVERYSKYDVINGKVANDNTNATITAYMAGLYGEVGSDSAANICVSLLLPERLSDQLCFRSAKAIQSLTFINSYQL